MRDFKKYMTLEMERQTSQRFYNHQLACGVLNSLYRHMQALDLCRGQYSSSGNKGSCNLKIN